MYNFKECSIPTKKTAESFPSIVENLWRAYLEYFIPADYVPRSGYYLCEVYPKPECDDFPIKTGPSGEKVIKYRHLMHPSRAQSDNEHSMSATWWCDAICSSFEYITPFRIFRSDLCDILRMHDLFEAKLGLESDTLCDVPDVYGPNPEKDEKEHYWAEQYLSLFPNANRRAHLLENFTHMQRHDDIFGQLAYCFDKVDAVLRGLAYEACGCHGRVGSRGYDTDTESMKITGTDDINDNWFYSTIRKIEPYDCADFFIHFVAEVFRVVRGAYPAWLRRVKYYDFLQ